MKSKCETHENSETRNQIIVFNINSVTLISEILKKGVFNVLLCTNHTFSNLSSKILLF